MSISILPSKVDCFNSNRDEKEIFQRMHRNRSMKKKIRQPRFLLPPQMPEHSGKMTVVLDMDETLIHSIFLEEISKNIQGSTKRGKTAMASEEPMIIWRLKQQADIVIDIYGGIAVFLRPGVHRFLYKLSDMYEVVLWTAGQREYAEQIMNFVDPDCEFISYRLYREHTIERDDERLKDLRFLGRDMKRTVLIDNSTAAVRACPNNTLLIEDFYGDPNDDELENIWDFVEALDELDDIRGALKMSMNVSGILQKKLKQHDSKIP